MTAEWQPIETAPKDRDRILFVLWPGTEQDVWHGAAVTWKRHRWWPGYGQWLDEARRLVNPTHWLPQPAKFPEWVKP